MYIKVYDNSAEAPADSTVPDPLLVLEMENGQAISPAPDDLKALQGAPEWAKPILEAALRGGPTPRPAASVHQRSAQYVDKTEV